MGDRRAARRSQIGRAAARVRGGSNSLSRPAAGFAAAPAGA
ncbi:hypothetical protein [Lysobacter gummosus]